MVVSVFSSAREMAQAVADGAISAQSLLQMHFDRIDQINPTLNAIIWQDRDSAMATAIAMDKDQAAGVSHGPLHGVPITVKESYDLAGSPSTWGNPALKDNVPDIDSDAVQRYRAAGAIVFGKTNVPLNLADWQSFNVIYGTTSNPWDTDRTPGGSSGGSAAALATGMSALEVGSDIGSSIRNPSHYCGVFGLKPTWNAISVHGQKLPGWTTDIDIAVGGPMARNAEDLSLAFEVLQGPSRFEASQWANALPMDERMSLSEFRVAFQFDDAEAPVDTAYIDALADFADKLEASGATVVRDQLPDIDTTDHFTTYLKLLGAALSQGVSDEDVAAIVAAVADSTADAQRVAGNRFAGMNLSHREWHILDNKRRKARMEFDRFFKDFDIILSPVCCTPAFPKNEEGPRFTRWIEVNGKQQLEMRQLFWSGYSGVVGLPSVVGPMDQINGLPVGYQAIAGHGRDRTALAFARSVEREIVGFSPPPNYS